MALGLLMFGYAFYAAWFKAAPRFYAEWTHAAEYVPAGDARIVSARCTNYDLVVISFCDVKLATDDGRVETLTDARFGPAPQGRVRLMERGTVPPQYSTDLSLRTLHQRLAVFIVGAFVTVFFALGLAKMAWATLRPRATPG
jgi:hypothetical protein